MADFFRKLKDDISKKLHKESTLSRYLDKVETKTNVDRFYVALGIGLTYLLYLLIGPGTNIVTYIFGFAYPAWESMKSLESFGKRDDSQWLTYWVVFSLLTLIELITGIQNIPAYFILKTGFLYYLMEMKGAQKIYDAVLEPLVKTGKKFEKKLDNQVDDLQDDVRDKIEDVGDKIDDKYNELINNKDD